MQVRWRSLLCLPWWWPASLHGLPCRRAALPQTPIHALSALAAAGAAPPLAPVVTLDVAQDQLRRALRQLGQAPGTANSEVALLYGLSAEPPRGHPASAVAHKGRLVELLPFLDQRAKGRALEVLR